MGAHILLAFVSGIVIEALYALGVLFIGARRGAIAGGISIMWGAAFLLGVNESFKSWIAAGAWCFGLGVGTVVGVMIGNRLSVSGDGKIRSREALRVDGQEHLKRRTT